MIQKMRHKQYIFYDIMLLDSGEVPFLEFVHFNAIIHLRRALCLVK